MDVIFNTEQFWPAIVLRLGLATVFFAHSAQQLGWLGAGGGLQRTVGNWRERYGIPIWLGLVGVATEFFGSFAMVLGFLTRPFALGLMIFMFVAMWKAHWKHGFFLAHRGGEGNGIEFCLMLFLMALALLVGGGGSLSLDLAMSR